MYDEAKFQATIKWLDDVAKTPTRRHHALRAKEFIVNYVEASQEELCHQALHTTDGRYASYLEDKLNETASQLKQESQWLSNMTNNYWSLTAFSEETLAAVRIIQQITSNLSVYGTQSVRSVEIIQQLLDGIVKSLEKNKRKASEANKASSPQDSDDLF